MADRSIDPPCGGSAQRTVMGTLTLAGALAITGCYEGRSASGIEGPDPGHDDGDDGGGADDGEDPAPARVADDVVSYAAVSGIRRLTIVEYDATLFDLLGDDSSPARAHLPTEELTPFDNDYTLQEPSSTLVSGAEDLARGVAASVIADPERYATLVPCAPQSPTDAECFEAFVRPFLRRAFRRPASEEDVARYASLATYAEEAGQFSEGVRAVVQAALQDPRFLYRVEIGTPVAGSPGVLALDDFELASRLSYLLWGSMPDDALLDRAQEGDLSDPESIGEVARQMLEDARLVGRLDHFHAQWLGYSGLTGPFAGAMREESRALMERVVVTERAPWTAMLTWEETYVGDELATHYGLPAPGSPEPTWVGYGAGSGRGGLLSHGTVLSNGGKFGDTSPTMRGIAIRTRVLCQEIPSAPPGVNVDDPPGLDTDALCKKDRYATHAAGGCAGCHDQLDPIGFGLESYDAQGAFRTHEVDLVETEDDESQCEISGDGEIVGVGTFNGPGELGALLAGTPAMEECLVRQLYRFTTGRSELEEDDLDFTADLAGSIDGPIVLDELIVRLVMSDAFRFRREEGEG